MIRVRFPTEAQRVSHTQRPHSSVDRALDFGSRCRRFDPFCGQTVWCFQKKHLVDANSSPETRYKGYWSSGMISRLGREGSRFDSAVAPKISYTYMELLQEAPLGLVAQSVERVAVRIYYSKPQSPQGRRFEPARDRLFYPQTIELGILDQLFEISERAKKLKRLYATRNKLSAFHSFQTFLQCLPSASFTRPLQRMRLRAICLSGRRWLQIVPLEAETLLRGGPRTKSRSGSASI